MGDPRRVFESKDMAGAVLYAKRVAGDTSDAYPLICDTNGALMISGNISVAASGTLVTVDNIVRDLAGNLCVNMTVGTVSLSSTASTITNAAGNPVNVALTQTVVSVTLPAALSTTASTINNAVGNPVNVSLTSTAVTIANTAGTVTNSVSTIAIVGRTLTGSTGSLSATYGTISITPTNKAKVYAFSLTTTSASEVTCIFCTGAFTSSMELWRVTLMAPAGTNAGANLAISPPAWLFASRSASAVSLSLSTAVLVHYTISYFDEA